MKKEKAKCKQQRREASVCKVCQDQTSGNGSMEKANGKGMMPMDEERHRRHGLATGNGPMERQGKDTMEANGKGERPMGAGFARIRHLLLGPKALGPKAKFVRVRHRLLEKARGKGQRRAAMVQRKRQGKGTIEAKAPLWRLVKGEGPMKATGTKAGQRPNGEGGQRQSSCPPLCLAMCR